MGLVTLLIKQLAVLFNLGFDRIKSDLIELFDLLLAV